MKLLSVMMALLLFIVAPVQAGSNNNNESNFSSESLSQFAKGVEKVAANHGARAFIIARLGRPAKDLPEGISFTHTAVAVYSNITLDNGDIAKGYAIYNLYQDAENADISHLIQDYPVNFYAGASELTAGIIIPDSQLQMALVNLVHTGNYQKLHNPHYSVIANPHNSQRQNCTEFTLDMINAAIYKTTDTQRLKRNAQNWFTPQKVGISRFKLSLGGLFSDGITTRDHDGKIKTATFLSIARYLKENQLLRGVYSVNADLDVDELDLS